ncbi:hypothetical protein TWF696_003724 [Orbilia brochopaga]|uniref:Ankyrin n=1 Tax=Orbilia brochopaga TaxID=3140254 RepID=A0AAV9V760_9PEZI
MVTSLPVDGHSSKPILNPPPPTLDEDAIDDLLYFARTGELDDLRSTINELATSLNRYAIEIAAAAVDSYSGNTCLHMAAANNHGAVISCILALEQPDVTPTFTSTNTSTTPASTSTADATTGTPRGENEGSSAYVRALVNWPNSSGNTPLHWACLNGHIEAVKVLVKAGADPGVLNGAGHDCVYEAEVNDKSNVVEWVLNYAESLESGVGVVGEDDDEKDDERDAKDGDKKEEDNAKVLRDEGRHHEEKAEDKAEESNQTTTAERLGQLGLEDLARPPTIR